jgi:hypothetical protein
MSSMADSFPAPAVHRLVARTFARRACRASTFRVLLPTTSVA